MSFIDTFKKYLSFILIIIIILLALASYLFIWPKFQEYRTIKKEFDLKDEEIKAKEKYLPKLEATLQKLNESSEKIKIIESALPSNPSIASLYEYLVKTASENGLIVDNIDITNLFNREESKNPDQGVSDNINEMLFSIKVSGAYDSFKLFLENLYLNARIIEVKSLNLSSMENNFSFDLRLKTQSYNASKESINLITP